jgi:glycosyltransferase involved in cell wall biosynthesis
MKFILRFLETIEASQNIVVVTIGEIGLLERFKNLSKFTLYEIPWTNSDTELRDYYNGLSLFLSPSRFETFGFMPLEAMSCGTRVIGVIGSSVAEVCELDKYGWLVQDGDLKKLKEIVSEISNKEYSESEKEKMVNFVHTTYSIDVFLDDLAKMYKNLMEEE